MQARVNFYVYNFSGGLCLICLSLLADRTAVQAVIFFFFFRFGHFFHIGHFFFSGMSLITNEMFWQRMVGKFFLRMQARALCDLGFFFFFCKGVDANAGTSLGAMQSRVRV